MLPLLAFGLLSSLLGGGGYASQRFADSRNAEGADKVRSLLGSAPQEMGPPTEAGVMGQVPGSGSGLLGNMGDPATQAQFMQGLLTLPSQKQAQLASQMYGDLFRRVQEGQQFQQTERGINDRFGRTEGRLSDQFGQQMGQSRDQFNQQQGLRREEYTTQMDQWAQNFKAQRDEAMARLGIERDRLALERGKADAKGAGLPELKRDWYWTMGADGKPLAAPARGSDDWVKATSEEGAITKGIDTVNRYMDLYGGKEEVPIGGGKAVRVGGTGDKYLPSEARSELSQLRGALVTTVGQMNHLGTMQKSDLDRISDLLPDHSSLLSSGASKSSHLAAYEELRRQLTTEQDNFYTAHPWLVPPLPFKPRAGGGGKGGKGTPAASSSPSSPSGAGGSAGVSAPSVWDRLAPLVGRGL